MFYYWACFFFIILQIISIRSSAKNTNNNNDQYRRCRSPLTTEQQKQYEQLNNNNNTYTNNTSSNVAVPLLQYYYSKCEICTDNVFDSDDTNEVLRISQSTKTRAIVMLTSQPSFEKLMIIAGGLLSSGSRVTIITGSGMPEHQLIREFLFRYIPCDKYLIASILLTFKSFTVDPDQLICNPTSNTPADHKSPGDIILCSIQNAGINVNALSNHIIQSLPSVIVVDPTCVSCILVAEREMIPTVMVTDHAGLYLQHVLGSPTINNNNNQYQYSIINPYYWYNNLINSINNRLCTIDMISSFIALNRIRNEMNLGRVRTIADIWLAGSNNIFLSLDDNDYNRWNTILPNLVTIPGPVLPQCINCLNEPIQTSNNDNNNIPTIVLSIAFRNDQLGRTNSRRLMQAFALVRESIKQLIKDSNCNDNNDKKSTCWNGPTDFQVIRPGPVPEILLPDNIYYEETTFLDTLARHKAITLVSVCDNHGSSSSSSSGTSGSSSTTQTTTPWTQRLGIPLYCIDAKWPPREIAYGLLQLWVKEFGYNNKDKQQQKQEIDGLDWVVNIIERTGLLHDKQKLHWYYYYGNDMGRQLIKLLGFLPSSKNKKNKNNNENNEDNEYDIDDDDDDDDDDDTSTIGFIAVFVAWVYIISSIIYVIFRNTTTIQKFRLRRLHHYKGYDNDLLTLTTIIDELIFRLPDFDKAYTLWITWKIEQLIQYEQRFFSTTTTKTKSIKNNNNKSTTNTIQNNNKKNGNSTKTNSNNDVLNNHHHHNNHSNKKKRHYGSKKRH